MFSLSLVLFWLILALFRLKKVILHFLFRVSLLSRMLVNHVSLSYWFVFYVNSDLLVCPSRTVERDAVSVKHPMQWCFEIKSISEFLACRLNRPFIWKGNRVEPGCNKTSINLASLQKL